MMNMKTKILRVMTIVLFLTTTIVVASPVQAVVLDFEIDSFTYSYDTIDFYLYPFSESFVTWNANPYSLSADFSTDKLLSVTYRAPTGKQFVVNAPVTGVWFSAIFARFLVYSGVSHQYVEPLSPSDIVFHDLQGSAPGLEVGSFIGDNYPSLHADYQSDYPLGDFSFSALTINWTVPDDFDAVYTNQEMFSVDLTFWAEGNEYDPRIGEENPFSDPGQWVNIADISSVPEPATMLLLGTGLVGLAGLRRKYRK